MKIYNVDAKTNKLLSAISSEIKFEENYDYGNDDSELNNSVQNLDNTKDEDIEKKWPLLSMPDEDLTNEQLKMKRIQKMQKNAFLSRL